MKAIQFRFAETSDKKAIRDLLAKLDLPYSDIDQHVSHFIIAESNNEPKGVIGLEIHGSMGLLRSLAVKTEHQSKGLGTALTKQIMDYSRTLGVSELYLLTLTAESFFTKQGFRKIERTTVPDAIKSTVEFSSLCPVTAVCMMKTVDKRSLK